MKKIILLSLFCVTALSGVNAGEFKWIQPAQSKEGKYQKTWKCPYCHFTWPIGKPCKNSECPSKYSDNDEEISEIQTIFDLQNRIAELEMLVNKMLG